MFRSFVKRWGISHVLSFPSYPQSNKHAEAFVKKGKHLIVEVCTVGGDNDEAFDQGLMELQNTLRPDGRFPAQMLYGRPAHRHAFTPEWQAADEEYNTKLSLERERAEWFYNHSSPALPPLRIDIPVCIQDHNYGRQNKLGVIVGIGKHSDYHMKVPSRKVLRQNRLYLPHCPGTLPASAPIQTTGSHPYFWLIFHDLSMHQFSILRK